jgi:hypothetical protein
LPGSRRKPAGHLRAFRKLEGQQEAGQIGAFLKDATGKTLFQLQREAQLGFNWRRRRRFPSSSTTSPSRPGRIWSSRRGLPRFCPVPRRMLPTSWATPFPGCGGRSKLRRCRGRQGPQSRHRHKIAFAWRGQGRTVRHGAGRAGRRCCCGQGVQDRRAAANPAIQTERTTRRRCRPRPSTVRQRDGNRRQAGAHSACGCSARKTSSSSP